MKQIRGVLARILILMAMVGLTLTGGVWAAEEGFFCAPQVSIDADTAGTVMLEDFSCFFKKYEGLQALHFRVGLKNVGDAPQRYRVNIFLDNGKAVGGLIPRKTGKGLIKPGDTASFVYPVTGMTEQPNEIFLKISTSGP